MVLTKLPIRKVRLTLAKWLSGRLRYICLRVRRPHINEYLIALDCLAKIFSSHSKKSFRNSQHKILIGKMSTQCIFGPIEPAHGQEAGCPLCHLGRTQPRYQSSPKVKPQTRCEHPHTSHNPPLQKLATTPLFQSNQHITSPLIHHNMRQTIELCAISSSGQRKKK